MLTRRPSEHGFTLIELAITLVVFGILIAAAVPAYQTWNANTQIRTMAESLQNGIRLAQGEAVKRNRDVSFIFTSSAPQSSSGPPSATAPTTTAGLNWVVRDPASDDSATTADEGFIQGKAAAEGSRNAQIGVVAPSGFGGVVTFNGLGRMIAPTSALALKVCNSSGGDRPLGIVVSTGGKVRMCNPRFSEPDPQACPPSTITSTPTCS